MKYPYLSAKDIERAADHLLHEVFGDELPVPVNLDTILFDFLAEKEQLAFDDEHVLGGGGDDRILGRMSPFENRIDICATLKNHNQGRHSGRYRFTVSHEIGHWRLHRPLHVEWRAHGSPREFAPKSVQFHMISLNRDVFSSNERSPPEEVQANRFAARLLMPNPALLTEFVRRFGEPPFVTDSSRTVADTALELAHQATPACSVSLCDAFQVSRKSMAIALESRSYLTDHPVLL